MQSWELGPIKLHYGNVRHGICWLPSGKPSMKKKKKENLPTVIWGIFHFHTTALYWAEYIGSRSPNLGKQHASCTAALVVFLISGHCSRLYLLFGPWQAERQRMLMNVFAASTIWEASHFHFLSCKSWVLNSSYAIKMEFAIEWWTLLLV